MDPNDLNNQNMVNGGKDDDAQQQLANEHITFTLTCDHAEIVRQVIDGCIKDNDMQADDYAAALHTICLEYTRNHPLSGSEELDDVQTNYEAA